MRRTDFPWPSVNGAQPQWTGSGFLVGGAPVRVLSYSVGDSGWSDGLTQMHESCAGTDHPIDHMSREWAGAALRRHLTREDGVIIDVGCSSGLLLNDLQSEWPSALVIGSDFVLELLDRLAVRQPGVPLVQCDITRCPLPGASIDAIVMLNVLEHIPDDAAAVAQVVRILKPGGVLVVEVPAGPHLFDVYDEYLQHQRRYTASAVRRLLESAGLTVLEQSHLGFSVYPAFAATKRRNQKRAVGKDEGAKRRIVQANIVNTRQSSLLRLVLTLESWAGRFVSYPTGIRVVAVGRKAAEPGQ